MDQSVSRLDLYVDINDAWKGRTYMAPEADNTDSVEKTNFDLTPV
jgi:hypothetical protein